MATARDSLMRVVVTGASGFVGRVVCQRLAAANCRVTAIGGRTHSPLEVAAHEVAALGNLSGRTDWSPVLAGADAIVHLAGKTPGGARESATAERSYREANVDVTRGLAEAALRAGVRRLVFVSSIKVNGETTRGIPLTAQSPPAPGDLYGVSKAQAEAVLFDLAPRGLEIVVLRPPLMYGPGMKGNMARFFALADRGIPVPFASIANARDILSVDSFADLIERAVHHPAAPGKVFLARDGQPISTPDLFRAIARALGKPARVFAVPVTMLRLAGKAMRRSDEIERLVGDLEIDDEATRKSLDWTPPPDMMEKILLKAACWWRSRAAPDLNRRAKGSTAHIG